MIIIDLQQVQAARGRGFTGITAAPARQQGGHVINIQAKAADLNQCTGNRSDHVVEESVGGNIYISSQSAPALRTWTGKKWQTILDIPGQFRAVVKGPAGKLWAGNTITGLYLQP